MSTRDLIAACETRAALIAWNYACPRERTETLEDGVRVVIFVSYGVMLFFDMPNLVSPHIEAVLRLLVEGELPAEAFRDMAEEVLEWLESGTVPESS